MEKHSNAETNVEKARIWSEIITEINTSNYMSLIKINKFKKLVSYQSVHSETYKTCVICL